MNKYEVKRLIFDMFENTRILFNDYYNGKEDYTEDDIDKINVLLRATKEDIENIESEITNE